MNPPLGELELPTHSLLEILQRMDYVTSHRIRQDGTHRYSVTIMSKSPQEPSQGIAQTLEAAMFEALVRLDLAQTT